MKRRTKNENEDAGLRAVARAGILLLPAGCTQHSTNSNLDAYELEAEAVDARSGARMPLYQVIVPDDTGYFIAQGLSRANRAAELFPEFRRVTASFRRESP